MDQVSCDGSSILQLFRLDAPIAAAAFPGDVSPGRAADVAKYDTNVAIVALLVSAALE